jgi:hypothetical protein
MSKLCGHAVAWLILPNVSGGLSVLTSAPTQVLQCRCVGLRRNNILLAVRIIHASHREYKLQ